MKNKAIFFLSLITVLTFISSCTDKEYNTELQDDLITRSSYSTSFINQVVNTDKTVSGSDIYTKNVTVNSNATLVLRGSNTVTIEAPFIVNAGAQLQITH